jgi:alpha-galactosidase
LNIYNENYLSKAEYKGELYDIGYDKPETHSIQKDDTLYYAFLRTNGMAKLNLRD